MVRGVSASEIRGERWRVVELWTPGPPYAVEYHSARTGDWFRSDDGRRFWSADAAEDWVRSQREPPCPPRVVREFTTQR